MYIRRGTARTHGRDTPFAPRDLETDSVRHKAFGVCCVCVRAGGFCYGYCGGFPAVIVTDTVFLFVVTIVAFSVLSFRHTPACR
jgi:hypothetical protein